MHPYQHAVIGNYSITGYLGRAPSIDGHVLSARDAYGTARAIKIGARGTEDRVIAEAKTIGQLSHPNIITLCETGDHHGSPYIVLAPLCPTTLEQRVQTKPLDAENTHALARPLLSALAHAHAQDIYHADLAPRHVIYTKDGRPTLCDFGNSARHPLDSSLESARRLGSMPYMNVHQMSGGKPNQKMDLYATGMILAYAHQGKLWNLLAKPSEDTFLAEFITKLVSENGYKTADEALRALHLEEQRDVKREALEQENEYLRTTNAKLHQKIEANYGWSKTAIALGGIAGFFIGAAAAEPLIKLLSP